MLGIAAVVAIGNDDKSYPAQALQVAVIMFGHRQRVD
jgi:hypothetical protein